jgi:hypothetical protein
MFLVEKPKESLTQTVATQSERVDKKRKQTTKTDGTNTRLRLVAVPSASR